MLSIVRRFTDRTSGRVTRAVLLPLTTIYVAICLYAGFLVLQTGNRLDEARLSASARTLASTWNSSQDPGSLTGLASEEGWERIWIVSATGRIVSSSEHGEIGALVDGSFWDSLPATEPAIVRSVNRAGSTWTQFGYHDLVRGQWAMILLESGLPGIPNWLRLAGFVFLAAVVWLIMALAIATILHRHLDRGFDSAETLARKVLDGEAVPQAVMARERAAAGDDSWPPLAMDLAIKLQEQAQRSREAESRFAALLDALPGALYVASFEQKLLVAGAGFRRRLDDSGSSIHGRPLGHIPTRLPLEGIHEAATRMRDAGLLLNGIPVDIEAADGPVRVYIAFVVFRGTEGYVAYLEDDTTTSAPNARRGFDSTIVGSLLDATGDVVVAFDSDARTLVWNHMAERFTGVSRGEVPDLKRVVSVLFQRSGAQASFMEWLEHQPSSGELSTDLISADGEERTLSWSAVELTTDEAAVGGALIGRFVKPVKKASKPKKPRTAVQEPAVQEPAEIKKTPSRKAAARPAALPVDVKKTPSRKTAVRPAASQAESKPARGRKNSGTAAESNSKAPTRRG